jgi:hypothetical protein
MGERPIVIVNRRLLSLDHLTQARPPRLCCLCSQHGGQAAWGKVRMAGKLLHL